MVRAECNKMVVESIGSWLDSRHQPTAVIEERRERQARRALSLAEISLKRCP